MVIKKIFNSLTIRSPIPRIIFDKINRVSFASLNRGEVKEFGVTVTLLKPFDPRVLPPMNFLPLIALIKF